MSQSYVEKTNQGFNIMNLDLTDLKLIQLALQTAK